LGCQKPDWTAKLGFALDTRDDLVNPRTGFYYHSSGEVERRKISAGELLAELNLGKMSISTRFTLDVDGTCPSSNANSLPVIAWPAAQEQ
jgi:hypothetical protein